MEEKNKLLETNNALLEEINQNLKTKNNFPNNKKDPLKGSFLSL
ncbi:hypothetical protein [Italian clover phyllody phytoplasma]|nr:hypothetical protein [Italian clover phyllody phytoplasma]